MASLVLEDVSYSITDKGLENKILNGVSATFDEGTINVILGPSGCGKTTLLRCICGLNDKYDGHIRYDNEDIDYLPTHERQMSYVSQTYSMYPHMTIFDSIAYPLKLDGAGPQEIKSRVYDIATKLDILPILSRKPKQVSGGQLQRACLARALIKLPKVCLLDEPLSNLDQKTIDSTRLLIRKMLRSVSCTVIYVTHDAYEATSIGENIYIMENGSFVYRGSAMDFATSKDPEIKKYLLK